MKWPAGNENIHVSQKKINTRSLCICCLKVIEGQVSLSTVLGTLREFLSTVHFPDILMVLKDPRFNPILVGVRDTPILDGGGGKKSSQFNSAIWCLTTMKLVRNRV